VGWYRVSGYDSGHFTRPTRATDLRNSTLVCSAIRGFDRSPAAVRRLLSWPGLTVILGIFIVLAAGPLQNFDRVLAQEWYEWILPESGPFLAEVIDPIASQSVAVPLLGLVAVILAWRTWSLHPIIIGALTEFAVVGVGGVMKLFFGRPSPKLDDPSFFHAGVLSHGWRGISFPSGHLIEAVALYGVAVLLLARYTSISRRTITLLTGIPIFVTVITTLQSFYMMWHWATDLVAGFLVGLVILRAAMAFETVLRRYDRIGPIPLRRRTVPWAPSVAQTPHGSAHEREPVADDPVA